MSINFSNMTNKQLYALINTSKVREGLYKVLPVYLRNTLTPERLISMGLSEITRQSNLLKCTPFSIISALKKCAEMGLEPGTDLGHVYFKANYNKYNKKYECIAEVGYKGFILLAYRQGILITSRAVYRNDNFKCSQGLDPVLIHELSIEDEGELIGVYAIATLKNNKSIFEYLPLSKIEEARNASFAQSDSLGKNDWSKHPKHPWNKYFDSMAKKTVIRRLFKYLPISMEMALAVNYDEQAETGFQNTTYTDENFSSDSDEDSEENELIVEREEDIEEKEMCEAHLGKENK